MDAVLQNLNMLIDAFLEDKLSAELFEKEYTLIYDFSDFENIPLNYLIQVRSTLERYTDDVEDLNKFPEYYIGASQLKKIIHQLTGAGSSD